jgi:hypothetical protein
MAAGEGINLAAAARSKLAPSPHHQRQARQQDRGQDQGGRLGKDGDRSG